MPIENVPVDRDAIREEFERDSGDRKSDSGASGTPIYLLKKGITQCRIMPPLPGKKTWFREFREHPWSPGGKFRRDPCPTNVGAPCPVCDEGKRLYQSQNPEDVERAKKLRPRRQFILNAVILSDPEGSQAKNGVQVVRFGVKVKRQLVRYDWDFDGGWGNMTDLLQGFDVRIEKVGDTMETTEYFVHGVPRKTNIAEVLAAQGVDFNTFTSNDLDAIAPPTSFEQLQALLKEDFVPGFSAEPTVTEPPSGPAQAPEMPVAPPNVPQTQGTPPPATPNPVATPVVAPNVPPPFTTEEK
jgi:hypothetical protein